jgi:hypothetical protein
VCTTAATIVNTNEGARCGPPLGAAAAGRLGAVEWHSTGNVAKNATEFSRLPVISDLTMIGMPGCDI